MEVSPKRYLNSDYSLSKRIYIKKRTLDSFSIDQNWIIVLLVELCMGKKYRFVDTKDTLL